MGKRIEAAKKTLKQDALYSLKEALTLCKDHAKAKFDETVELVFHYEFNDINLSSISFFDSLICGNNFEKCKI